MGISVAGVASRYNAGCEYAADCGVATIDWAGV